MSYEIRTQIFIREQTKVGKFTDAINMASEEFSKLSEEQIQNLVADRVAAFVARRKNPPVSVSPTETELLSYKIELQEKLQEVENKLSDSTE
jgi:hypothetical protein